MKFHHYAVIMAGGRGTRFWPLSRSHRPKHLLKVLSEKSLIRETADRLLPLFGPQSTLIVTVAEHYDAVRKELPALPRTNFLTEPQGKNTAPCIGLAAIELIARDPNAIMTVLPADHWISNAAAFRRTLKAATQLAERHSALVTVGLRPGYPETGYGYILRGKKLNGPRNGRAYQVKGFKEKPSPEAAAKLIKSGALWNSGIFAWRAATILAMLRRFEPALYNGLEKIGRETRGRRPADVDPKRRALVRREYKKMPNISIDYAVMERAGSEGRVLTLEADFGWSDVGNWASVHRMLPQDGKGNTGVGKWLGVKSRDCLVYSPDRLVVLLGTHDMVVVDTPDALLVGDMKRAQEVRDVVEELKRKGYGRYTVR
jgi:mannose-1-phosphate guanylyltransferase